MVRGLSTRIDHYSVLGVSPTASLSEIKKAYFNLAKQYHPDTNKSPDASKKFLEIQQAYEILSDPGKRGEYDRFGTEKFTENYSSPDSDNPYFSSDIFRDIFSRFAGGPYYNHGFSGTSFHGLDPNIQVILELTFEEAALGARKVIQVKRHKGCSDCHGSGVAKGHKLQKCQDCQGRGQQIRGRAGFLVHTACQSCQGRGTVNPHPCQSCHGSGSVVNGENIEVTVPAGVSESSVLTMATLGNFIGGSYGDLFLHFKIRKSSNFDRKGLDIYSRLRVDFLTAILGGEITVPTIHGSFKIDIPSGTQPNDVKRLVGKGISSTSPRERGDHYVTIEVVLPKLIEEDQREVLINIFSKKKN